MTKELTENQKRLIEIMRLSGASYPVIAKKLKCHPETVGRYCRKFHDTVAPEERTACLSAFQKLKKVLGW